MPMSTAELDRARELLKRFEQLEGDSAGLSCLTQALGLLAGIIKDNGEDTEKEVAQNMLRAYRAQLQKKAGELLDGRSTFRPETLEYWALAMLAVSNIGLESDEKFNTEKVALLRAWLAQSLSPPELDLLRHKLATESNKRG